MTFLTSKHEPLRRYLYGVVGSVLAVLLVYGVVTAEQAAAFGAIAGAALLVPAVEVARSKVTPVVEDDHAGDDFDVDYIS